MSEQRAQILEMLVAGRLTVEQAEQLLAALDGPSPSASRGTVAQAAAQRRGDEQTEDFFASLTAEQLVALRDSGVSRLFVEQMRAAGLNALSLEDLIELRPAPDATTRHTLASLEWARQWPCEEVWKARKTH